MFSTTTGSFFERFKKTHDPTAKKLEAYFGQRNIKPSEALSNLN